MCGLLHEAADAAKISFFRSVVSLEISCL